MSTVAIFWKNKINNIGNFLCGVLTDGYPILPNARLRGLNINECRTVKSLKNYIPKWQAKQIAFIRKRLTESKKTNYKYGVDFYSKMLNKTFVTWSFDEYDNIGQTPDYHYVLKNNTVYVHNDWDGIEFSIDQFFLERLSEEIHNFRICVCENCLVKVTCSRSIEKNTLCDRAYNEAKLLIEEQLNM